MASLEEPLRTGEISPRFDQLLKDVVDDLSPEELEYAVSSIKTKLRKESLRIKETKIYSHACIFLQIRVLCRRTI